MNLDMTLLLADLQRDEGFRSGCYEDTRGFMTIGYGRNLTENPLSRGEATVLLGNDIDAVLQRLTNAFSWWPSLTANQQRGLSNLTFNVGMGSLYTFRQMLACLAAGDGAGASKELLASEYATQVGGRAQRIAALLAS